jgi:hypothetical protein
LQYKYIPEIQKVVDIIQKTFVKNNFGQGSMGRASLFQPFLLSPILKVTMTTRSWCQASIGQCPLMFVADMMQNSNPHILCKRKKVPSKNGNKTSSLIKYTDGL